MLYNIAMDLSCIFDMLLAEDNTVILKFCLTRKKVGKPGRCF